MIPQPDTELSRRGKESVRAFSICIPNYNYERYLGETIKSVQAQQISAVEILIADNASTDGSVRCVQELMASDPRIVLKINRKNVGFSRNLEKAASLASGDWITMLSSDDLLEDDFLSTFDSIIDRLEPTTAETTILSSTQRVIGSAGETIRCQPIDWRLWNGAERNPKLSERIGADVYELEAGRLLHQSLKLMRTPFTFASTTYHRRLYDAVEGYSQTAIINPDKKFAWAILGQATHALIVDKPLVSYRVHSHGQGAQQLKSGALKHLTDQYIATFEIDNETLAEANLTREDLARAFIEEDIVLRGLLKLAEGDRNYARRSIAFGKAAYPQHMRRNKKLLLLNALLSLGPAGSWLAKRIYDKRLAKQADEIGSQSGS